MITDFASIYARFDSPILDVDCGTRCSPHNDYGVPFCCDTSHAIPSAYTLEWDYLKANTDLWHLWDPDDLDESNRLQAETPEGQVLIECQGHLYCQRPYRSLTCRAFPFFPFITRGGEFIGLSYYWRYEDRCWVISNLDKVTIKYRNEFVDTFDRLFRDTPQELENFRFHSGIMRRVFGRAKRTIPLLHRDGKAYAVTPRDGQLNLATPESFPKFGLYEITVLLPFPDELKSIQ
jgi:hypothetical protein